MQAASDTHAMAMTSFCGHVSVPLAQGGMPLCVGSDFVALKIAKEEASMERMMRLQLKFTPRRANLAMRTRALILCRRNSC